MTVMTTYDLEQRIEEEAERNVRNRTPPAPHSFIRRLIWSHEDIRRDNSERLELQISFGDSFEPPTWYDFGEIWNFGHARTGNIGSMSDDPPGCTTEWVLSDPEVGEDGQSRQTLLYHKCSIEAQYRMTHAHPVRTDGRHRADGYAFRILTARGPLRFSGVLLSESRMNLGGVYEYPTDIYVVRPAILRGWLEDFAGWLRKINPLLKASGAGTSDD